MKCEDCLPGTPEAMAEGRDGLRKPFKECSFSSDFMSSASRRRPLLPSGGARFLRRTISAIGESGVEWGNGRCWGGGGDYALFYSVVLFRYGDFRLKTRVFIPCEQNIRFGCQILLFLSVSRRNFINIFILTVTIFEMQFLNVSWRIELQNETELPLETISEYVLVWLVKLQSAYNMFHQ